MQHGFRQSRLLSSDEDEDLPEDGKLGSSAVVIFEIKGLMRTHIDHLAPCFFEAQDTPLSVL